MSDNIQTSPTERKEPLAGLERFCQRLDQALGRVGLKAEEEMEIFYTAITAECPRCEIKVSGEELYAISRPPSPERANAKIGRLRRGYCAREGCPCDHYRLLFLGHSTVNWLQVLAQTASSQTEPNGRNRSWISIDPLMAAFLRSRSRAHVGLVLVAALLLLLARHWYQGGSIPFIRQPEHFRVDPSPEQAVGRRSRRIIR